MGGGNDETESHLVTCSKDVVQVTPNMGQLCLPIPKFPRALAAPSPCPALPIPTPPLHHSSKHSPLETNIPLTCKSTGLLHTYLPLSYASLRIYISYIQCSLFRFLEKISFLKKHQLCQPGTEGSAQPVQPHQKIPPAKNYN